MDYENQEMIERLFNDKQAQPLLMRELGKNTQLQENIDIVVGVMPDVITREFIENVLIHLIQAKRTTVPALAGMLRFHFAQHVDAYQRVATAVAGMIATQLVGFDYQRMQVVIRYDVSEQTHNLLHQYMYLPPMTIPPLDLRDNGKNRGSGYITQKHDSLLLQDNHHDGELCVDHLNACNRVPLSINEDMVKSMRNSWKNIEKQKPDETFEEYQKRLKAFEKFERDSFLVMALMLEMGNKFYFTHKYDKRGRTYAQGYQIQYQGNDWQKAVVELANKEKVR